jgi:hypothetical protein
MNEKLGLVGVLFEAIVALAIVAYAYLLPNGLILLVAIEVFILMGGIMIVIRAGSDDLFKHLDGLGPISWSLSFIPFCVAAFVGILLDR